MNLLKEAYSGFDGPDLASKLRTQGATRVFSARALATDYCVKHTVLDARKLGFGAVLLSDAIACINAKPRDVAKAINEIIKSGAEQGTLTDSLDPLSFHQPATLMLNA